MKGNTGPFMRKSTGTSSCRAKTIRSREGFVTTDEDPFRRFSPPTSFRLFRCLPIQTGFVLSFVPVTPVLRDGVSVPLYISPNGEIYIRHAVPKARSRRVGLRRL